MSMYSTFPPGTSPMLPPGLPAGQLFASSPQVPPPMMMGANVFAGSGGVFNANTSQHPQQRYDSVGSIGGADGFPLNDTSTSAASALGVYQTQQMFFMLQTVYHQQQALQSQMNQLCVGMQQLQHTMAQMSLQHQHQHHEADKNKDNALNNNLSSSSSGIRYDASKSVRAEVQQQSSNVAGAPTVTADSRVSVQNQSQPTNGSNQVPFISHPLQQQQLFGVGEDGTDVSTPLAQVNRDSSAYSTGAAAYDPPRRSPSKPAHTTPVRILAGVPPPLQPQSLSSAHSDDRINDMVTTQLPSTGNPANTSSSSQPQQVVLTWDPKRYSRSSSASSSQHNDSSNNPLVSATVNALHHNTSVSRDSAIRATLNSSVGSGSGAPTPAALNDRWQPEVQQSWPGRPQPQIVSRPQVRPTGAFATQPSAAVPVSNSNINVHDVSLSDDGYVSNDTIAYLHRHHLR